MNRDGHVKQHGISEDDYQEVVDALEANCQVVRDDIVKNLKALRAARKAGAVASGTNTPLQKSPSKSALRGNSQSPSKTPAHKRKVAFSPTKATHADTDSDVEATPSKRPKFLTPSKHSTRQSVAAFRDALRGTPSPRKASSRMRLDQPEEDEDEDMDEGSLPSIPPQSVSSASDTETDIADAEMSDGSISSIADSSMDEAPMTPRRSTRQPKPRLPFSVEGSSPSKQSPTKRGKASHSRQTDEENMQEKVIPRRCRPVLLEHSQWLQRDLRADKERKAREQWVREMVKNTGDHPFEYLRTSIVI